jgi:pimeloyl-ACP methyl ester carboxylesterase
MTMGTYVLCHGAFAGGWRWRERGIVAVLAAAGHQTFTPTYTGLGERVHLARPEVDLNTHVQDVLMVLQYEALDNIILVGWSYGGLVITAVAEQVPERMAHLVYLDAFAPLDGQSLADISGPELAAMAKQAAHSDGDGWQVPPDPELDPRHTAHPLKTIYTPVEVKNPAAAALPHTYIYCTEDKQDNIHLRFTIETAARVKADPGWQYYEIKTDHSLSEPEELCNILLRIA